MSISPQEDCGEPFVRDKNEMVLYSEYRPYILDPPESVPHYLPKGEINNDKTRFVYQHILFKEDWWHQKHLPKAQRDRRYRAARELSYSQVALRTLMELKLHLEKEKNVDYFSESTLDGLLQDYFEIDMAAAAALRIEEIKNSVEDPGRFQVQHPPEIEALSDEDKVGIFEDKLDRLFHRLTTPRIVAEDVVTSALLRLVPIVASEKLTGVAHERRQSEFYYPLRIPKIGTLRGIGGLMLKEAVGLTTINNIRHDTQALQTEVDQVELKAA